MIAAESGAEPRRVRALVRLGGWLQRFGVIGDAFGAGRISLQHVQAIRGVENPRTRVHLPEAQAMLVEAGESLSWPEFVAVLRYWELAADPDGEEPAEQMASRSCRYRQNRDGSVSGRFELDPVAGQAFVAALEAEAQALFRQDAEDGTVRTAAQRRADALVRLVCSGDGVVRSRPLVHVVLGEEVLAGGPVHASEPGGRCEFVDGMPVHPDVARALALRADLRRFLVDGAGELLDLGRRVRGFPPWLKQALLVAARGQCAEPGCDAPIHWLQADHVIPWARGGSTSWGNGQILCDPHNKAKRDHPPKAAPP